MLIRALSVATIAVMTSALDARAEPVDPAQAIAQKFAEESDEQKPAKKPAPVIIPKKVTPKEPGADYEADMLERARAEELDRQKQEARQAEVKLAAPIPAAPAALPVIQSSALAPTPPVLPPAPAARPPAQAVTPASTIAALPTKPAPEPTNSPALAPRPGPAEQATVLIVLDTSTALGFKPDPIICIDDRCWLSNGIGAPALAMPRTQAVALPTTDDATTDSCSGKSACVYRGVAIDPAARLEVIEVGEGHGASAGAYTVATDTSCRKDHSTLLCDNGLATQNFRIWVVPEATAVSAGTSSIEDAVAEGLPDTDAQPGNDK